MKKLSFLVMIAMLALSFSALPVLAQDDAETKAYGEWYKAYQARDWALAAKLAKDFVAQYPNNANIKYVKGSISKYQGILLDAFNNSLRAYSPSPDAAKLEKLIADGEKFLEEQPDHFGVITFMALSMSNGVLGGFYKDTAKTQTYVEKALKLAENPTPPEGWKPEDYKKTVDTAVANLNFYLGYTALNQASPNLDDAEKYLARAAGVKSATPGEGWKDARVYWTRAEVSSKRYADLSRQYSALSEDDKRGDKGKVLLDQINPLIDKMIADYARVVAVATSPATKQFQDAARESLKTYWEYKYKKPDGMNELVKGFEADPTVEQTLPPAPAESTAPPPVETPNVKPGLKPGATTGKPAPSKPAAKPAGRRKPR
ncbi:MAG TPA: hypothetical protein VNQ79_06210 [Blastocatellia bacterium]|nr:hypothetical protein [Blastocatellia bacterium]